MSDLEKFLQQAAQRMKERQQGGGQPAQRPPQQAQRPPQAQQPQQNRPQQPRQPLRPQGQVMQAEIVEAQLVDSNPRERGPDRLSNIDTRPRPGTDDVNMADERMASHVQQVFEHGVGQLSQKAAIQISDPSAAPSDDRSNRKTEVQTQARSVHWLAEMMQQPETVRALFIASEVFKRKF
ncbi:MAG: hypothetical protein U0930_19830 [Pirellulales bacterium]